MAPRRVSFRENRLCVVGDSWLPRFSLPGVALSPAPGHQFGARRSSQEPLGRLPWFADFLRRVARLLVRLDIVGLRCGLVCASAYAGFVRLVVAAALDQLGRSSVR